MSDRAFATALDSTLMSCWSRNQLPLIVPFSIRAAGTDRVTTVPHFPRREVTNRSGSDLVSSIVCSREVTVTSAVSQIRRQVTGLTLFSGGEIRRAVEATIDDIIQHLSGQPSGWEGSRRAGRRNATADVPIEDMLLAYHLCAAEVWGNYTAVSDTVDHSDYHNVASDALRLWDAFERATAAAVTAYRVEEFARAHADRSRRDRILKRVLRGSTPTSWAQLADVCGWHGLRRAAVAIAASGGLTPFLFEDHLGRRGITSAWLEDETGPVGLIRVRAGGIEELRRALSRLETGVVAVGPVATDPKDLPRCNELARLLLRARRDGGVVTFTQDPFGPFVAAAPGAASELVQHTLGSVLGLPAAERDGLLVTLEVFIETAGSTAAAAHRLFCHRNTVLNRLRRVEEITGFAPTRANDLTLLCLALRAYRFQQEGAVR